VAELVEEFEFVAPIGTHGATASANTHRISATSRRTSLRLATSPRPTSAVEPYGPHYLPQCKLAPVH